MKHFTLQWIINHRGLIFGQLVFSLKKEAVQIENQCKMACYISVFAKVECHGNSFTKYFCLVYLSCHGFTHQDILKGGKYPMSLFHSIDYA